MELNHPLLARCDDEAADLFPADGMAGFLFQAGVKPGALLVDTSHARSRPKASDHSRGMPGRAATDLVLLEQHDVLPAHQREVVGDTGAGDASADDDDTRFRRER